MPGNLAHLSCGTCRSPSAGSRHLTASCGCTQRLKSELNAPDYEYDAGLRDQNGIAFELKRGGARALSHVKLVNWGYCLNCYWRDLQGRDNFTYSDQQARRPHALSHTCQALAALQKSTHI